MVTKLRKDYNSSITKTIRDMALKMISSAMVRMPWCPGGRPSLFDLIIKNKAIKTTYSLEIYLWFLKSIDDKLSCNEIKLLIKNDHFKLLILNCSLN